MADAPDATPDPAADLAPVAVPVHRMARRQSLEKALWELQCDGPVVGIVHAQEAGCILTCTAQQLTVWDQQSHAVRRGVRGYSFWQALSYAPDLQCAIMGGRDGMLVLWDINSGETKRELSCGSAIASLDYAQSLKVVLSGEENGTVILWDMTRGLQLAVVWCGASVNCLAYWFIAPYITDIPHMHNGEVMRKLIPATERGTMGRTFLTGDAAFKVTVWDIETGAQKKVFNCHSHVLVLAVSPFLGLIAAGEANGRVTLWDAEVETVLHRFEGGALRSLHFTSAGDVHGLLCAESMRLISWDIDTGQFRSRNLKRPSSCSCASSLCILPTNESAEGEVESGLLLVGDSSGLVRALPLGSLEATRGHDEKRCGDGVRLRSCVRS